MRNDKARLAFQFLVNAENKNLVFSLEDLAAATGWSASSTRTNLSKKLHFLTERDGNDYHAKGVSQLSEDVFVRLLAQRIDLENLILRPRFTTVSDTLIDKSRESALLGVQIYNNPLVAFRTPGYIVQMIIAHTALFHAIFERKGIEYWYKNPDGSAKLIDGDNVAWDVSECLRHYYAGDSLPEVENLRFFVTIRNKIEHRFVPQLDAILSGKCQALLMNYEQLIVKEFGQYFALGSSLALALQFSSYTGDQHAVLRRVQSTEYDNIRRFVEQFDAELMQGIVESSKYSFRAYLIPKIGNHAKSSDVAIEFVHYDPTNPEEMAKYEKQIALIREKLVPAADMDMNKASDVAKIVTEKTGIKFSTNDHTRAWKFYKVRPKEYTAQGCNTEYCRFNVAFKQFVYTNKWIAFLCAKIADPTELARIRSQRI